MCERVAARCLAVRVLRKQKLERGNSGLLPKLLGQASFNVEPLRK